MTKKKNDPDPICDREELVFRVSNVKDGEDWRERSLRSAWVCGNRACVLDAMAWVERANDGTATIYGTDQKEVHL